MKITPMQQYVILGVAVFFGIVFVFYQFFLKPLNTRIDTLQATLQQKKQDLEEAKKIVAKYVEFKKQADSVQRELEWYQNRIPKAVDKAKLLEAVSFLQSRSGVILTSFQFQQLISGKDYSEIPVLIRFNSDFRGLSDFLYQASISSLLMTAHDLVITPITVADHLNFTIQAQMTVSGIQAK